MTDPRFTGDEHLRRQSSIALMVVGGLVVILSGLCSAHLVFENAGLDVMMVEMFGWIPILLGLICFVVGLLRYRRLRR
jgi:hypothetical protein